MSILEVPGATAGRLKQEFEELFREHSQMLYRTAYSMLDNRADAEDVLQTIFVSLLRRDLPPDFAANPKGYLYRAAVNHALNVIRVRKRHNPVGDVESLEIRVEPSSDAHDTHRRLAEAIAELDPGTAQILILRYVHGHTDAEIAKLLGVSRGTIAMRVFRSRARIKKLMREGKRR
jgi:RNA polymerase sigma-70 factor, ECF subfamily